MQLQGIIHGQQVTLSRLTGFPNGTTVMIDIRAAPLALAHKRTLVDRLCGAWARDDSIPRIFAEIAEERHQSAAREVNFDAAA